MAVHNDMFGVQPPLTLDDFKHCTWMGLVLARARRWIGRPEVGAWAVRAGGGTCRGRKILQVDGRGPGTAAQQVRKTTQPADTRPVLAEPRMGRPRRDGRDGGMLKGGAL